MPSAERRLPKYAALAAPVLLFAANACSENKTQTPNPTQEPTLGGQVKPEVITPRPTLVPSLPTPSNIENFDPNEGQIFTPTPEHRQFTRNTITARSANYEYELYTNVTLDEVIRTANALPQSSVKPVMIEDLTTFKTTQNNQPGTDILISLMDGVITLNDASCQGNTQEEFAMLVASYLNQNFPTQLSNSTILEQGACTPIIDARSPIATSNQDVVPAIGLSGQLYFWTDKYSYALSSEDIQAPGDRFSDPVALSIAFGPNIEAFEKVFPIAEEIDRIRQNNTYDPAQLPLFQQILDLSTNVVCDASRVGGTRAYIKGLASVENYIDPDNWPTNANKYTNHYCFWGDRY